MPLPTNGWHKDLNETAYRRWLKKQPIGTGSKRCSPRQHSATAGARQCTPLQLLKQPGSLNTPSASIMSNQSRQLQQICFMMSFVLTIQ